MAAAAPCRIRAAMKVLKLGAMPHSIDARVKVPIAPQNRLRAPTRSASQPDAGMHAATANI
jgi:hypothetical protein